MSTGHYPTDPDAETIGFPEDGESREGSMPEPAKHVSMGVPNEIGRYKILGIIGTGGMGSVYEAMQESPRRRVALKVIKAGSASDMALRRFEFEGQVLAKLHHSNIAQIYEAGMWESPQGPVPYFAMEYIPGARPIVQYVDKKDLPVQERLKLFIKVCEAVHHAHQKGIIHRDLKPDNILIDSSGEPKIIDFGVARATDADMAVTTMQTTMGQLIGTLQYMSPEQCDADPDAIDTRSDVYALGVIMFQLLSGKLPYDLKRQAIHEAVRVIQEVRPDSLSTISLVLKGDVDTIAQKALEKDRDRRYQSASDLAHDISHYLNNEPIDARPLSIVYQVRLFSKKYKRTVAAVLALVGSIILGLIGTSWGLIRVNTLNTELAIVNTDLENAIVEVQERFTDVRQMSDTLIGDIYAGVVKVDAAMEVRELVLTTARSYLEKLRESNGEDPDVLASIANSHSFLGGLLGGRRGANRGQFDQALEQYHIALEIREQLLKDGQTNKEGLGYGSAVALAYINVADIYMQKSLYQPAIDTYRNAEQHIDGALARQPDLARLPKLRIKAAILQNIADCYVKLGREDEAVEMNNQTLIARRVNEEESSSSLEKLRESNKDDPDVLAEIAVSQKMSRKMKRDLVLSLRRVGHFNSKRGEVDLAIEQAQEALKLAAELSDEEPENGRAVRDLAWSYFYLASAEFSVAQPEETQGHLGEAVALLRNRCVTYPNDADATRDILTIHNEVTAWDGYTDYAAEMCRATLILLEPVVESLPGDHAIADVFEQVEQMLGRLVVDATPS